MKNRNEYGKYLIAGAAALGVFALTAVEFDLMVAGAAWLVSAAAVWTVGGVIAQAESLAAKSVSHSREVAEVVQQQVALPSGMMRK